MKTFVTIISSLVVFATASYSAPQIDDLRPEEEKIGIATPIAIRGAIQDRANKQVTVTFTEQEKFDPQLMIISVLFFKASPKGLVVTNEQATSKWTVDKMGVPTEVFPKLILSGLESFDKMVVEVTYDSEEIEKRTFKFK